MKTRLRISIGALLVASVSVVAARSEPWTLERAVEAALANNPDAGVAQARIESAGAMLDEASSYLMPQLSLKSGYTQTNSPMMAFGSILNQRAFDFGLDFNHPGVVDNLNATATVGVNLYAGGRVASGRRAAQAGLNAADLDWQATKQQIVARTVEAYLGIRKAEEAVRAVEAGVKAYEAAVFNARLRYDAGQVLKSDLLSLEVQLARTREQWVEAKHFRSLAERNFTFILGLPASEIDLAESDPTLAIIVEPDALDFSQRPELLALRERETAALEMRSVAAGARKPSVTGFASYQYDYGWETNADGDSWMAGVAVNLDIFDGGKNKAKIRQAEAQLAEIRQYRRKAELGIELEVEQSRLALELAKDRVAVTKLALQQAEEAASLSRARFEEGSLLTAELIGVEGRLMEARMRSAVAEADKIIAIAQMRRALGIAAIEI